MNGTCACGNIAVDQSTCNDCDLIEWTECSDCGNSLADDEDCIVCLEWEDDLEWGAKNE